jgi:hypothetical protein
VRCGAVFSVAFVGFARNLRNREKTLDSHRGAGV